MLNDSHSEVVFSNKCLNTVDSNVPELTIVYGNGFFKIHFKFTIFLKKSGLERTF